MKITKRMKKILLFLLQEEKLVHRERYYKDWEIMSKISAGKHSWNFTHSEKVSHRRTLRIMVELGFLERFKRISNQWLYEYPSYKLTNRGREAALEFEREILDFIKEYQSLVSN